jgi:hypothetical protein
LFAAIGAVLITAAVGIGGYFTGKKVMKAEMDTIIATAPHDTAYVPYAVQLPPVPPKKAQGKPAPMQRSDSADVDALLKRAEAGEARADSLEQEIWRLATPYVTETETPAGVIRVLALPLQKQTEAEFKPEMVQVQVPQITIKVPVPVPEPWYEDPLYFIGGVAVGAVIVLITN